MQVTLDLPDDISAVLEGRWPDLPRQALEALAVDAYRTGALTEGQVRRLLQLQTPFLRCMRSSRSISYRCATPRRTSRTTWRRIVRSVFFGTEARAAPAEYSAMA